MIYTRGRPQDWDRIAADGNYGWSYEDVLKYYIRSENAKLKGFDHNPYRGRNGELPVEFTPIRYYKKIITVPKFYLKNM